MPINDMTDSFFCFAFRNLWFEAIEPGGKMTFYHFGDTLWTIHREVHNIQVTNILKANRLSGLGPGLGDKEDWHFLSFLL